MRRCAARARVDIMVNSRCLARTTQASVRAAVLDCVECGRIVSLRALWPSATGLNHTIKIGTPHYSLDFIVNNV